MCSAGVHCLFSDPRSGVEARSNQRVLCVQDLVRGTAAWYNQQRSRKPQTFEGPLQGGAAASAYDPTGPSKPCDFCDWQHLTAADPFGRCVSMCIATVS